MGLILIIEKTKIFTPSFQVDCGDPFLGDFVPGNAHIFRCFCGWPPVTIHVLAILLGSDDSQIRQSVVQAVAVHVVHNQAIQWVPNDCVMEKNTSLFPVLFFERTDRVATTTMPGIFRQVGKRIVNNRHSFTRERN